MIQLMMVLCPVINNEKFYPLIYDKKPDFDNEFLSVVENSDGSFSVVYATPLGQGESADMVKQQELSAKYIEGLKHFAHVSLDVNAQGDRRLQKRSGLGRPVESETDE